MRFTKANILESFTQQDRSYRLSILCSHWLRNTAPFAPSAAEEARSLRMTFSDKEISFTDLGDLLENQYLCQIITSHFCLNQLQALIRAPFEFLTDYCEDFTREFPASNLLKSFKETAWYDFARLVRNAISHNFHYDFKEKDLRLMPFTWNGISITKEMNGQPISYNSFWHKPGYELFMEMRVFAEALPETSA